MKPWALAVTLLAAGCGDTTEIIAPTLGSLRVESSMSGTDIDRDGISIAVDETIQVVVASQGAYVFNGLVAGSHSVRLAGLAPNCSSSGSLERTVTIGSGTAVMSFSAVCTKVPLAASGLIAFARAAGDQTWDLWVMNNDGTGETKLRDSPGVSEYQPAWTPDGQSILFASYDPWGGGALIARINRTGTGFVLLASSASSPNVSPDGQRVVFVKHVTSSTYDIWVMDIDGANQQPLTTDTAFEDHPTWSADGSQIVFERGYRLYVMNADGTEPHMMSSPDAIEDRWPTWSPDGSRILFVRRGFGQDHLYTIRPDGTELTPLTSGLDNDNYPAWAGDGQDIAFSSGRGGVVAIWRMRHDGSDMWRVSEVSSLPFDSYPAWSR